LETGLPKVRVGGQRLPQPHFPHHREARAIGKRKLFVPITEENSPCVLGSLFTNRFALHAPGGSYLVPPIFGSAESKAQAQQSQSFVDLMWVPILLG
jgi:hypothetical protein